MELTVERLQSLGWEVRVEYTFNRIGERGSVDIVAWLPARRALLLVEVKTIFTDLQDLLSAFGRKIRVVPRLLEEELGWSRRCIGRVIVALGTTRNRSVIVRHAATFATAYPGRASEVARWLRTPDGDLGAIWFVSGSSHTSGNDVPRIRQRVRRPSQPAALPELSTRRVADDLPAVASRGRRSPEHL